MIVTLKVRPGDLMILDREYPEIGERWSDLLYSVHNEIMGLSVTDQRRAENLARSDQRGKAFEEIFACHGIQLRAVGDLQISTRSDFQAGKGGKGGRAIIENIL